MTADPLRAYIDAWNANDTAAIVAAVTGDTVIIESHGPVYRGADRVRQWADTWFARGGVVHRWDIVDEAVVADRVFAQWRFAYRWEGEDRELEGCTVAQVRAGRIAHLREYATRAPLYDWKGHWQ